MMVFRIAVRVGRLRHIVIYVPDEWSSPAWQGQNPAYTPSAFLFYMSLFLYAANFIRGFE